MNKEQFTALIVLCIVNAVEQALGDSASVQLAQGAILGKQLISREGKEFYGFMGIPYAQTPERFQPAKLPPPTWEGVYDATNYRSKCIQFNLTSQTTEGVENDCLFVNVFSPKGYAKANLSVLAFIHGGGFQFGLAYENGPEFILDHEVVFVTFSYRLAALGFLSTGDDVLPGNLGMKDQLAALQWIQNNIHHFGGDKNRVTLAGESAGAASVSLHMVSPLSSGLFRHAICQSGSALDRWSIVANPKESAVKLAVALFCPTHSSEAIVSCLKTKSAKEIIDVQLRNTPIESLIAYGPVIEQHPGTPENPAFLTESPFSLYEQGKFAKVPMIMTVNSVEGLLLNALSDKVNFSVVLGSPIVLNAFENQWSSTILPAMMLDKDKYSDNTRIKNWVARTLREFYFGTNPVGPETLMNLTNIYSDNMFNHRTRKTALMHGKNAPVYLSVLAFEGIWSQTFAFGFKEIMGMTHADDLSYLFTDFKYPPFPPGSDSELFSKLLVKLWINFTNYGDPGFVHDGRKWLPLHSAGIRTKVITWLYLKQKPEFLIEPLQNRMFLWDSIDRALETGIILDKDEL